jgi:Protein of unknown function (DUF3102)
VNRRKKKAPPVRDGAEQTTARRTSQQANQLQVATFAEEEAKQIRQLHESVMGHARHALDEAIHIGRLLVKVKDTLKHGQWLPWLEGKVPFSERTAQNYIACFNKRAELKSADSADLSIHKLLYGKPKTRGSTDSGKPPKRSGGRGKMDIYLDDSVRRDTLFQVTDLYIGTRRVARAVSLNYDDNKTRPIDDAIAGGRTPDEVAVDTPMEIRDLASAK